MISDALILDECDLDNPMRVNGAPDISKSILFELEDLDWNFNVVYEVWISAVESEGTLSQNYVPNAVSNFSYYIMRKNLIKLNLSTKLVRL